MGKQCLLRGMCMWIARARVCEGERALLWPVPGGAASEAMTLA
jgi:hypothetical protein